jgi:hypothetical protein
VAECDLKPDLTGFQNLSGPVKIQNDERRLEICLEEIEQVRGVMEQ